MLCPGRVLILLHVPYHFVHLIFFNISYYFSRGIRKTTYVGYGAPPISIIIIIIFCNTFIHNNIHVIGLGNKLLVSCILYLVELYGIQVEFHGMPWMLCYFHGISVEFYSIQVECHGMPWTLYYFHGISVKFHGISVECHGIPWDTEDWYSGKISEWI